MENNTINAYNLQKPITGTKVSSKRGIDVYVVGGGAVGGSASGGGGSTYYAKPAGASGADAVSAYASATTLTVTGLPFTFVASDIEAIIQIPNAGGTGQQSITFSDKADFSVSGTTITVAGASFSATDEFVVIFSGQEKAFSSSNNADRNQQINPPSESYVVEIVTLTNIPNATPEDVYINMDGFRKVVVQLEKTGGSDTFDVDFESSVEGCDSTVAWLDTTSNWTFEAGSATADFIAHPTNDWSPRGHRLEITTSGAGNDADFRIFIKKYY